MTKEERQILEQLECSMCSAILREMHLEVVRHNMTSKGVGSETQVMETSAAICLAMLQNYRIDLSKKKLLRKKTEETDHTNKYGRGMEGWGIAVPKVTFSN
eukprot:1707846-Amphidinium_carterae.1